jgi:hypothetical protein
MGHHACFLHLLAPLDGRQLTLLLLQQNHLGQVRTSQREGVCAQATGITMP